MTDKMANCNCPDCKKEIESLQKHLNFALVRIAADVNTINSTLKDVTNDIKIIAARLDILEGNKK